MKNKVAIGFSFVVLAVLFVSFQNFNFLSQLFTASEQSALQNLKTLADPNDELEWNCKSKSQDQCRYSYIYALYSLLELKSFEFTHSKECFLAISPASSSSSGRLIFATCMDGSRNSDYSLKHSHKSIPIERYGNLSTRFQIVPTSDLSDSVQIMNSSEQVLNLELSSSPSRRNLICSVLGIGCAGGCCNNTCRTWCDDGGIPVVF